ncbi:trypsin-1 [Drosophila bipectinata]|uniref:trypsin-1 n=1 Tax=Drosophila bipectinata TaxID=42026 RepID=UPI001C895605|nr:trypsin-1 [Drosophila bipectinata]
MYKLMWIFIFFLLDVRQSHENHIDPRIVGGFPADIATIPYIVSIQLYGIHHCGGSIINNRTILTAAHCLAGVSRRLLKVKAGGTTRDPKDGKLYPVAAVYHHEKWSAKTMDYDIGLLRLTTAITYSRKIKPIKISSKKVADGKFATIAGWGFTSSDAQTSQGLRYARVPIVNHKKCTNLYGKRVTDRMVCAGYLEGGTDACQMDSGGPLVFQEELIGIVSWGVGCAQPNKPGVYARLETLASWVNTTLNKIKT